MPVPALYVACGPLCESACRPAGLRHSPAQALTPSEGTLQPRPASPALAPAQVLELAGFTGNALKEAGFRGRELKECGLKPSVVFTLAELKREGFTPKELLEEGYALRELKDVW